MRTSPLFKQVDVSCVLAMECSRRAGANQARKKAAVIPLADEYNILSHSCTCVSHPRGLQRRAVFYLLCRFAIHGVAELYNLGKQEFKFGEGKAGMFVQYDERLSKNYKVSLDQYQDEHFRAAVIEHDQDMVTTLQALIICQC